MVKIGDRASMVVFTIVGLGTLVGVLMTSQVCSAPPAAPLPAMHCLWTLLLHPPACAASAPGFAVRMGVS